MDSMIERVARAIYEGRNGIGAVAWAHRQDGYKTPYRIDARAAIEAMREPTEAMVRSCWSLHHPWGERAPAPEERTLMFDDMAAEVSAYWQTMIDAALQS